MNRRQKAPKPKPNYKVLDPLKHDFHGQEAFKLVSKEYLNSLAEFLVKKNPLEENNPQNLKLLTGFIGMKESEYLAKKLAKISQKINDQKTKQKTTYNVIENIKEKCQNDEALKNLRNDKNFEEWGLIYLKNCKSSAEAVNSGFDIQEYLPNSKNSNIRKKITFSGLKKKNVRITLLAYEYNKSNNDFLLKVKQLKKIFMIISDEIPENVEILRKLLEQEIFLPKKSRFLQKMQILIVFFAMPNSEIFEEFETWLRKSSKNVNITLLEEPHESIKKFLKFQFFSKLAKFYEKQAYQHRESEIFQPDLRGIIAPNMKNPSISYEKFLELLNLRLFPGEELNRVLMDELLLNWFVKNEKKFDFIDFNKIYQKALRKISRLIEVIHGKIDVLKVKQKELRNSFERSIDDVNQDEFLAVKIEEFIGINEEILKKNKKNAGFNSLLEVTYAGKNEISNKFSLLKNSTINEKFLLQYVPDENFIIKLRDIYEKSAILSFCIVLKELKPEEFVLGVIKETVLKSQSFDPELSQITLKLRYKRLRYSHEKTSIKLKKCENILKNLYDYLTLVYRCKYELLEVFAPKTVENSIFLNNHIDFLENVGMDKPLQQKIPKTPIYDEEIAAINKELDIQRTQIKLLQNSQYIENNEKLTLEAEIKKLQESLQTLKEVKSINTAVLQEEFDRKSQNLGLLKDKQTSNILKIEIFERGLTTLERKLTEKERAKQYIVDKRSEIVAFFTFGKNSGFSDENLRKLQEYFLYVQKSILKFYNKAVIIEADIFQMKASNIKAGLGCLAGSVPFIGHLLKYVVETAIELKKKWDEHKFVRKCLKFSTLIHSQRILAEVTEETAFQVIKDPKKQALILEASELKTSTMEKLKEKLMEFFNKTKEFFLGKKNKTQEQLLKDLNTASKLLGNIDGGYLCTQAVELYKQEHMQFDPEDPYNKKGLVKLFVSILLGVDQKIYEKVIKFEEMKDFKAIVQLDEESLNEKVGVLTKNEPTHEEIKALALEDVNTQRQIEEINEEISSFRKRQEKNENKLMEIIEEHNTQNQDLQNHEKRINSLEKQAILGFNYLEGLNQEVSDLKERIENLYLIMNLKYQEILKKVEKYSKVEENLEGSAVMKKTNNLIIDQTLENDRFYMYLEKSSSKFSGSKTLNKKILRPLNKK